jgi:hypothetical protein
MSSPPAGGFPADVPPSVATDPIRSGGLPEEWRHLPVASGDTSGSSLHHTAGIRVATSGRTARPGAAPFEGRSRDIPSPPLGRPGSGPLNGVTPRGMCETLSTFVLLVILFIFILL